MSVGYVHLCNLIGMWGSNKKDRLLICTQMIDVCCVLNAQREKNVICAKTIHRNRFARTALMHGSQHKSSHKRTKFIAGDRKDGLSQLLINYFFALELLLYSMHTKTGSLAIKFKSNALNTKSGTFIKGWSSNIICYEFMILILSIVGQCEARLSTLEAVCLTTRRQNISRSQHYSTGEPEERQREWDSE